MRVLRRISLLFLDSVAVSDILLTLLMFVPMLVTLCSQRWVFGAHVCYFTGLFRFELLLFDFLKFTPWHPLGIRAVLPAPGRTF